MGPLISTRWKKWCSSVCRLYDWLWLWPIVSAVIAQWSIVAHGNDFSVRRVWGFSMFPSHFHGFEQWKTISRKSVRCPSAYCTIYTNSVLQNILEFYASSHCTHEVPKVHCIVGFSLISMVNYACYTIWCFSQGSFELKVVRSSTTAPCTWFVTVRRVWIVGMRGPVALAWQNLENCKAPTVWTIASRIQKRYEKMRLEYLWAEKGRG